MAGVRVSAAVAAAVALAMAAALLQPEVAEASISCGTVSSKLAQCTGFLTGSAASPSSSCCSGVQSLYSLTQSSRSDRVTACGCIKQLASAFGSSLKSSSVSSLPGDCGVNLGYGISTSTNCNSIS